MSRFTISRPNVLPFRSGEYHLRELKIARDPDHPGHVPLPHLPPESKILDVGCGAGQTLIASYPERVSFGLDIDFGALRLGQSLTDRVRFACGSIDALPYRAEEFDFVIARVSLPYTNIRASLREIWRVLKAGGTLWMTLHAFPIVWKQARRSRWRGKIFFVYIMLNSILFHIAGRQFPFLGKYESFQTGSGIRRALLRNGFERISIAHKGSVFLVTACTTPGRVSAASPETG